MLKPKDLPNQDGFKFIGIAYDQDGCLVRVPCVVVQDQKTKIHYTEGVKYCDLIGWESVTGTEQEAKCPKS